MVGLVGRLVQNAILYQPVPTSGGEVGTSPYNVGKKYTTESVPTLPTFFSFFSNNAVLGGVVSSFYPGRLVQDDC